MLLALFSLVTLFADDIHNARTIVARSARWSVKEAITFSDALAAVRRADSDIIAITIPR